MQNLSNTSAFLQHVFCSCIYSFSQPKKHGGGGCSTFWQDYFHCHSCITQSRHRLEASQVCYRSYAQKAMALICGSSRMYCRFLESDGLLFRRTVEGVKKNFRISQLTSDMLQKEAYWHFQPWVRGMNSFPVSVLHRRKRWPFSSPPNCSSVKTLLWYMGSFTHNWFVSALGGISVHCVIWHNFETAAMPRSFRV